EPSFRELIIKDYKSFKIEVNEFGTLFEIRIDAESDFILAINNPEKINCINYEIEAKDFPYKLFISGIDFNPLSDNNFQVFWDLFSRKIKETELNTDESVFISGYY